jgi:2'-5' RNA ligase
MKSQTIVQKVNKFGLFLIPNKETQDFVNSWKARIEKIDPEASYLSHPVHSTLFLFNSKNQNVKPIIKSLELTEIEIKLKNWLVFKNDSATKGKDTLVIEIEKTKELMDLQLFIANKLNSFSSGEIKYDNKWTGDFKKSHQNYGYPFIGNHWIPHLTIASLNKNNGDIINIAKNTPILLAKNSRCNITLFKINNDMHECIHRW